MADRNDVVHRIFAADLGLVRLTSAVRATGAWVTVVAVLLALLALFRLPVSFVTPGLVAVSVSTMSLGMDLEPRRRLVPLLLMAVTGAAGLSLGTVVLGDRVLTAMAFFGLAVATLLATLGGAAGTLLALVAVASFYTSTLVRSTFDALPLHLVSLVIGAVVGALMLGLVLRERPHRETARLLGSVRACLSLLAAAVPRGKQAVRVRSGALSRAVAECRRRIAAHPEHWPAALRPDAGGRLAELEVRADREVERAFAGAGSADLAALAADPVLAAPARKGIEQRPDPAEPTGPVAEQRGGRTLLSTAVQLLVACAVALVVAQLIDPVHWFWCVLAALVMLFGTTSASDSLGKGARRVIGTAAGLPVGLLLAAATHDHLVLALLVVLVAQFAQQVLGGIAYGWSMFFITVLLSVLFGRTTSDLVDTLDSRLLLTAVGAAIGAVVALLVLPTRTGALLRRRADDVLAAVEATVTAIASRGPAATVDRAAREVTARFVTLEAEAGASRRGWPLARGHRIIEQQVATGGVAVRELRHVAHAYTSSDGREQPVGSAVDRIRERVRGLRVVLDGAADQHRPVAEAPGPERDTTPLEQSLVRLDQALRGLEGALRGA